jgi:hypothetical protein
MQSHPCKVSGFLAATLWNLGAFTVGASAADPQAGEWCDTHLVWAAKAQALGRAAGGGCPIEGDCDIPAIRDSHIPDASTPVKVILLHFIVFREDDGSNPAASAADITGQAGLMNAVFDPYRFQYEYTYEFVDDTTYRHLANNNAAVEGMKNAYAVDPSLQCNIYVTDLYGGLLGRGTFPWDPDALGNLGGIIIDYSHFGAGEDTLVHEMGHNLGLWHTHHGVSEVAQCGVCYEQADGQDADTTGDFCSDTPPTPINYSCSPPGGTDPCSATPWGPTQPENYMSYAEINDPDCWTLFVDQQVGREHCWTEAELSTWFYEQITAIVVRPDGNGDYLTIQEAIDAAVDTDEILVAPGMYNESIDFLGKAIWLHSSDGAEVTIIDAEGSGTVVICESGEGPDTVLEGFTITGGSAEYGGGMYNGSSSPTVINCTFSGNSADHGGGMYNGSSSPTVTFLGNTSGGGAAVYNLYGSVTVINCTFSQNTATSAGGGGLFNDQSNLLVANCIFWGDTPDEIWDNSGSTVITYSDVQGGWPGTGNIDADPLFVDPGRGDYRLTSHSPPIDAASNPAVPADVTTDLDGNPRFLDDPDNTDCWQAPGTCGDPPVVDMGAYEYQMPPCPWDCTSPGDDEVTVNDFLTMLSQWGNAGSCDFDGGGVSVTDFLALLAHWGPCP